MTSTLAAKNKIADGAAYSMAKIRDVFKNSPFSLENTAYSEYCETCVKDLGIIAKLIELSKLEVNKDKQAYQQLQLLLILETPCPSCQIEHK